MKKNRSISILLVIAMVLSLTVASVPALAAESNAYEPTVRVTHEGATFGRATEAYNYQQRNNTVVVEGMPLFNGQVEDFDAYIGLLLKEMGDTGVIALAAGKTATGSYMDEEGTTHTYTIPAGTSTGGEALMGAANQTELSTVMYQAQSWNKDLIQDIGYLIGSENKSKQDNGGYNWTSSTGTSMTDMRLNPLSGRYDEGYGEDSTMASIFADLNARGYNGYEGDEDGFYIMASVNTKHYTVYNAQWFRPIVSTQVGVRSFYEYNAKSANRGWENGTFSGFMSSYGRINGVPSSSSFITKWATSLSPYAIYSGTDAGADAPYLETENKMVGQGSDHTYGEWSNGYDEAYAPDSEYKAAFMAASGHKPSGDIQAALEKELNGVTVADCLNTAIAYLTIRVRTGIYDEKDANGLSKYYPFNNIAKNGTGKVDYTSSSSQEVALRNAQEGIVLLKNDNDALPIAENKNVGVYGAFAKAVNSGIYAVAVKDDYSQRGDEAGNNALESIQERDENATFDLGLNKVTIQVDGGYLFVDPEDADDGLLKIKSEQDYNDASDKSGYYFGILESGQGASSIYAYGNQRWLRAIISDPTTDFNAYVGSTTPLMNNANMDSSPFGSGWGTKDKPLVVADEACTFKQTPGTALPPMLSGYPYHFVMEEAENEGEYYIRAGAKVNGVSFVAGLSALMDKYYGYYLEKQDYTNKSEDTYTTLGLGGATMGGDSSKSDGLKYFADAQDKSKMTFKLTEVNDYGYAAADKAADDDYAIIFVGQSYLGLSGEGTDRVTLEMGAGQIESALNVAKTYKDANKKTVVVVYANYPVVVEELQNSEYVDAILFAGYGGQFGGKATAQVLFGEYNPTGRLVSTWYKDMELFPEIDEYSVPEGALGKGHGTMDGRLTDLTLEDMDDDITVDMTIADVLGSGLTYKYLTDEQTEEHVTYPFGYGLSYSTFEYSNLVVSDTVDGDETFTVKVDVKNTGSKETAEVVQIYTSRQDSAYGDAVAVKSLAGFEKVVIKPNETKTVTITVEPTDIALWDVNAEKYVVENGAYTLYAAHDSSLEGALSATVTVNGESLAGFAKNKENNIWEHSFQAGDVHYDEYSKLQTVASALADGVNDDTFAVTAKAANAWTAIPLVNLDSVTSAELTAGAPEGVSGTVELRLDTPDGTKIASFDVTETGGVTKNLLAKNEEDVKTIQELGYNTLTSAVSGASGTHDLYLVFSAQNLRVGTLKLITSQSSGSSGGSSSSSTTVKNEDGSTTTTKTDKATGTVTEITKKLDGSSTTVETRKDGTVTTTEKTSDGTTATTVTGAEGTVKTTVEVSNEAVKEAQKTGDAITLPIQVSVNDVVEMNLPTDSESKVEIPVANMLSGTVVVLVHADGTETVVKKSAASENGLVVMLSGNTTVKIMNNTQNFGDVKDNDWYSAAVAFVSAREIFNGNDQGEFLPGETMTRGMLIQVLYNLENKPEYNFNGSFTDVSEDDWFADAVYWAAEKEIVVGYGDGVYGADDFVSREQLAVILWRYAGSPASSHNLDAFEDAATISDFAKTAMAWANEMGILRGDGTSLNPLGQATRAEAAQMLTNFCAMLLK